MTETGHLKILHVASGDLWAGAEVQLFTLAKALHTKSDTSVSAVLLNYGRLEQELRKAGIKVTVLDESKLNGFQILHMLIKLLKKQQPSIVHTHRGKENILGSIAAFIAGGTASLRTAHGAPEHHPSWRQYRKRIIYMLDWLCGRYLQRKIIAVSNDLASLLESNFPANQICVIENGIDLELTQKSQQPHTSGGIGRDTFRVGLAGRLAPVKRVDIFIQTAAHLLKNYPGFNASFHIYGNGPMRSELERLSRELGTNELISFEGHSDDILKDLQKLDVLVMTSDHEGLPMILLEAMALQIPIIAHAVGGIPQLLDHGASGILVKSQDEAIYAREIFGLIYDSETRSKITGNALQHVIKNNSDLKLASSYNDVYMVISNSYR